MGILPIYSVSHNLCVSIPFPRGHNTNVCAFISLRKLVLPSNVLTISPIEIQSLSQNKS